MTDDTIWKEAADRFANLLSLAEGRIMDAEKRAETVEKYRLRDREAYTAEIARQEARAEAAEKEAEEFRAALDRGPAASVEAQAEINHWQEREAVLRKALQEIEDLAFVKLIDAYSIARAALEAKP